MNCTRENAATLASCSSSGIVARCRSAIATSFSTVAFKLGLLRDFFVAISGFFSYFVDDSRLVGRNFLRKNRNSSREEELPLDLSLLHHDFRGFDHCRHRIAEMQAHLFRAAPGDHGFDWVLADLDGHVRHDIAQLDFRDDAHQSVARGKSHGRDNISRGGLLSSGNSAFWAAIAIVI
jgi:hypothetical protein